MILPGFDFSIPSDNFWVTWVKEVLPSQRPSFVVIFLPPTFLHDERGTNSRLFHKTMSRLGYTSTIYFTNSSTFGSSVDYSTCIHVFRQNASLPPVLTMINDRVDIARGMEPDLVPFKIAPRSSLLNPTSVIGHTFLDSGLMPNKVGSFIETKYGIRRLVKTDLARAKGYWTKFSYPPGQDSTWESPPPSIL